MSETVGIPYPEGHAGGTTVTLAALAGAMPYPVELPETYGAKGDLKVISDAKVEGQNVTSASAAFTAADVGKHIAICAAGKTLHEEERDSYTGKIAAVISGTEIELETVAPNNVEGALAVYGTDDTEAIGEAFDAATEACQADGTNYCEVWFGSSGYMVAGQLDTTRKGNAQIPLPLITETAPKVTLVLRGSRDSTALPYWHQHQYQHGAPLLFSVGPFTAGSTTSHQAAYSAEKGRPAIIGGPTPNQGYEGETYNNMLVRVEGITLGCPQNATLTGIDLKGTAEAVVMTLGAFALGIPGAGLTRAENPNIYLSKGKLLAGWNEHGFLEGGYPAVALAMPGRGNNDNAYVGSISGEGWCATFEPGEHSNTVMVRGIYCFAGIVTGSQSWEHAATIQHVSVEECWHGVFTSTNPASVRMLISLLDLESNQHDIYDKESAWLGSVHCTNKEGGALAIVDEAGNPPQFLKVTNEEYGAGTRYQPEVPGSGVTYVNKTYFRDADVMVSGGKVSKIEVNSAGSAARVIEPLEGATVTVPVPSGGSITLTYTEAPTWIWVLR
jgi:hypothetical protein